MHLLVSVSQEDLPYLNHLDKLIRSLGHTAIASKNPVSDLNDIMGLAKRAKANAILLISTINIKTLFGNPQDFRGSVVSCSIPIIILAPLKHLQTTNTGKWILEQDLRKLATINKSKTATNYNILVTKAEHREAVEVASSASVIVMDIETTKNNYISSCSYSLLDTTGQVFWTGVTEYFYENADTLRKLHQLPNPKAFHNGSFDCFHLARFGMHPRNYILDTQILWWCRYAELRKSLNFISSMLLPDFYYWKDEAATDALGYNAKDTIATARCLSIMMKEWPIWAMKNYAKVFPKVFPTIACAFEGIKANQEKLHIFKEEAQRVIGDTKKNLNLMLGMDDFNPSSPKQVSTLLYKVLGAKKPKGKPGASEFGTDKDTLQKVSDSNPLCGRIIKEILEFREVQKAYSTYYNVSLKGGRLLYAMAIDGTATGRFSSSKSSLWADWENNYGAQIQNLTPKMKEALIADDGWVLVEIDNKQSEANCVAYSAEDEAMIKALTGEVDFFCATAERLFGLTIDTNHPLRQVTKKVVHGTNYMMRENTFIQSVGQKKLREYAKILKRPEKEGLKSTAKYLLEGYLDSYKNINVRRERIYAEVAKTGRIVTEDGWTRQVFGDIEKNQNIYREIVAHCPQHLSVSIINNIMQKLLFQVQFLKPHLFRLKAQIHDSLVFQIRKARFWETLNEVVQFFSNPVQVHGRSMCIGIDISYGETWKSKDTKKTTKQEIANFIATGKLDYGE